MENLLKTVDYRYIFQEKSHRATRKLPSFKDHKIASFGLIAVSLAACGGDGEAPSQTLDPGGDPGQPVTVVSGASQSGLVIDGKDQNLHVEIAGVSSGTTDSGEWVNITQITIRDADGDITLSDLQASKSDAASGGIGTVFALSDVGQTSAGTVTLDFDRQAVDQSDTVVTVSLNEVAGALSLTGGSIETLVLQLDDLSAAEASALTSLNVQGLTTLVIEGGSAGYTFSVADPLDGSLTVLNARTAVSDLTLDVTLGGQGTYSLGAGDDLLRFGDGLDNADIVDGGAGLDTVAALFLTSTIHMPTFANVESLNAVFSAGATFDGSNAPGLTTINLGIDPNGDEVDSNANVDFNNITTDVTTINIHASQGDVEVDYGAKAGATLAINFLKLGGAIQVGDDQGADIDLIGVKHFSISNLSNNTARVQEAIDLHEYTETIQITTTQEDGEFILNNAGLPAFANAGAVRDVTVTAENGWMNLATFGTFMDEATALQNHHVSANNANVGVGFIGNTAAALELEKIVFEMSDTGTLAHNEIFAFENGAGADIALLSVVSGGKNYVRFSPYGEVNVFLSGLYAEHVAHIDLNASEGGNIELDDQEYSAGLQTYSGSGDIVVRAGEVIGTGFHQTEAADASSHSGLRLYFDGGTDDTFFGSTRADVVEFSAGGDNIYVDSGGDDTVTVSNTVPGNATLLDGAAGSDDTYILMTSVGNQVSMRIGSGNDTVDIQGPGIHRIEFGTWQSGTTHIENFGAGTDSLSFNGVADLTSGFLNGSIVPGGSVAALNDNSVYFIEDGDTAVAAQTIADYENLSDVAAFLNAVTSFDGGPNHDNVFIVRNINTSTAPGDAHDVYIYLYDDDGSGGGIHAAELTVIGTIDSVGLVTSADIL